MNKAIRLLLFILALAMLMGKNVAAQEHYNPLASLPFHDRLLIQYADSNDLAIVSHCLREGAHVNATTSDSISALMYAVQNGNYYMVSLLLGYGADPNIKPYEGTSALHTAAIFGKDSIAVLLLNNKAKINDRNHLGLTPLHYSVWNGFPYLSDIFAQSGAAIDTADYFGNTPLILSIYNGTNGCAKTLLDYGANPNLADTKGTTPLMIAAQFDDTLQIRLLIENGADIKQKDKKGFDAIAYAISSQSVNAVATLTSYNQPNPELPKNYYQLAFEANNADIKGIIKKSYGDQKLKLSFEGAHLGIESIMGGHNFMWGLNVGFTENISKTRVSLRFLYRPQSSTTLDIRDMQLYQFKEKRQVLGINLTRNQELIRINRHKFYGVYYGLGGDLTFRNYRGTDIDPSTKIYLNAKAGLFLRREFSEIQVGWDYSSLKTIDLSPHSFGINLMLIIPSTKRSVTVKNIDYVY